MSRITTHVLDTALGRPAAGVPITLERVPADGEPVVLGRGVTDVDGRLRDLAPSGAALHPGTYRLTFDTGAYFAAQELEAFYPAVSVLFDVRDVVTHYHVPLLLSPYGYSTYRGS
jgi:5-hydroxyisourate hydrolase